MSEIATWRDSRLPIQIDYSHEALEKIRRRAMRGLMNQSSIGVELGGVLLGERNGNRVTILDSFEVPCSHMLGPSFSLITEEQAQGQALIDKSGPSSVLGWYLSKGIRPFELTDGDRTTLNALFRTPWHIGLLVQPQMAGNTRIGFFSLDAAGRLVKGTSGDLVEWQPAEAAIATTSESASPNTPKGYSASEEPLVVPGKVEAAIETVRFEPARFEPAGIEPAMPEPVRSEPAGYKSNNFEVVRAGPAPVERGTDPEIVSWPDAEFPVQIDYSRKALENIRGIAMQGLTDLPRIGLVRGGVLLGNRDGNRITIVDSFELPCSHTLGPSFALIPGEQAAGRGLIAGTDASHVLGWYLSKGLRPLELTDPDRKTLDGLFSQPWQIGLLVQPHMIRPARIGFFLQQSGEIVKGTQGELEEWFQGETPEPPVAEPAPSRMAETSDIEPVRVSSARLHALKMEQARAELVTAELPWTEQVRVAPAVAEFALKMEPARVDPPWFEPSRIEPAIAAEPARFAPIAAEPVQSAPFLVEPARRESVLIDPVIPEPRKPERIIRETEPAIPGYWNDASPQIGTRSVRRNDAQSASSFSSWDRITHPRRYNPWSWLAAAVVFIAILGAAWFALQRMQAPASPPLAQTLVLHAEDINGTLVIRWNDDAVKGVGHASMFVDDGGRLHTFILDQSELNSGKYRYARKFPKVSVSMTAGSAHAATSYEAPLGKRKRGQSTAVANESNSKESEP